MGLLLQRLHLRAPAGVCPHREGFLDLLASIGHCGDGEQVVRYVHLLVGRVRHELPRHAHHVHRSQPVRYFQEILPREGDGGVADKGVRELRQEVPGCKQEGTWQAAIVCQHVEGEAQVQGLIIQLSEIEETQQLSRDKLCVIGFLLLLVLSADLILHILDELDPHLQGLCGEDSVLGGCYLGLGDDLCQAVEYCVRGCPLSSRATICSRSDDASPDADSTMLRVPSGDTQHIPLLSQLRVHPRAMLYVVLVVLVG